MYLHPPPTPKLSVFDSCRKKAYEISQSLSEVKQYMYHLSQYTPIIVSISPLNPIGGGLYRSSTETAVSGSAVDYFNLNLQFAAAAAASNNNNNSTCNSLLNLNNSVQLLRLQTPPTSLWIPSTTSPIRSGLAQHPAVLAGSPYNGDNPSPAAISARLLLAAGRQNSLEEEVDPDDEEADLHLLLLKPAPAHYGVEALGEDIIAAADLSSPPEPSPMRHSPHYSSGHSGSRSYYQSSYNNSTSSRSRSNYLDHRPVFTRSQSVPETSYLPHQESGDEELLLEALAASLDDQNGDPLRYESSHLSQRYDRDHNRTIGLSGRGPPFSSLSSLPPNDHRPSSYWDRGTVNSGLYGRHSSASAVSLNNRYSLSSDLPTSRRSANTYDRLSALDAELEAAAAATRRLTGGARHGSRHKRISPPLTLGRSLQLVTENAGRFSSSAASAAAAEHLRRSVSASRKSVRFGSEEWAHQAALRGLHLNDVTLFPSGLGIDDDAWMTVEDVRTGRWARWDALVKQESQDSQTRDSGIETGSCFTSSEDSNRGSAADHHHHYYHSKKVENQSTS
jgi:hypothetical protein